VISIHSFFDELQQTLEFGGAARDQQLIESFIPKQRKVATSLSKTKQSGEHLHPGSTLVSGIGDGVHSLATFDEELFINGLLVGAEVAELVDEEF
jgi:hypothetical protein